MFYWMFVAGRRLQLKRSWERATKTKGQETENVTSCKLWPRLIKLAELRRVLNMDYGFSPWNFFFFFFEDVQRYRDKWIRCIVVIRFKISWDFEKIYVVPFFFPPYIIAGSYRFFYYSFFIWSLKIFETIYLSLNDFNWMNIEIEYIIKSIHMHVKYIFKYIYVLALKILFIRYMEHFDNTIVSWL